MRDIDYDEPARIADRATEFTWTHQGFLMTAAIKALCNLAFAVQDVALAIRETKGGS